MVTINTTARTAGEFIDETLDVLLDGLLRESAAGHRLTDQRANTAMRNGARLLAETLRETWCADMSTRFDSLPIPQKRRTLAEDLPIYDRLFQILAESGGASPLQVEALLSATIGTRTIGQILADAMA